MNADQVAGAATFAVLGWFITWAWVGILSPGREMLEVAKLVTYKILNPLFWLYFLIRGAYRSGKLYGAREKAARTCVLMNACPCNSSDEAAHFQYWYNRGPYYATYQGGVLIVTDGNLDESGRPVPYATDYVDANHAKRGAGRFNFEAYKEMLATVEIERRRLMEGVRL